MNQEITDLIPYIARDIARDYPEVSWQDVQQELWTFYLVKKDLIKSKSEGGNPRMILRKVANGYCLKERAEQLMLSVQYHYRPSDVKRMLESYLGTLDSMLTPVPDDAVSEDHINDRIDVSSDIASGIKRLKQVDKEALYNRYVLGKIPDNASSERKSLNKAVNNLTELMNIYRGKWTGSSRRAISNARANYTISEGY